jgi:hypothetical protein
VLDPAQAHGAYHCGGSSCLVTLIAQDLTEPARLPPRSQRQWEHRTVRGKYSAKQRRLYDSASDLPEETEPDAAAG